MNIDLKDVLEVTRQQLSQALNDAAMNAAAVLAWKRRVDEVEDLLREMKSSHGI